MPPLSDPPAGAVHVEAVGGPVRLGKLPVKRDKRNLKFKTYLPPAKQMPAIPKKVERSHLVGSWPMYGNDALADCTCATVGHIDQLVSAAGGMAETPPDQAVLDLYWATGAADDGRYCLDVLNRWQSVGFANGTSAAEKIIAFVQLAPKNHDHVKLALSMFGNVYAGVALPISAQRQHVWTPTRGADAQPGSWGGHAINYVDYTSRRVRFVTWGRTMEMTWAFHDRYCDEAYVVISPDWLHSGQSPADAGGFKIDKLMQDLEALRA